MHGDDGQMNAQLVPKLLVTDADAAIAFYTKAFGAELQRRVVDHDGVVNHAEIATGSIVFAVAQSVKDWGWIDPESIGGSPVLLVLTVTDPDSTADRMVEHGAQIVIPIDDRPYGKREGRIQDPFGHLWVISGDLQQTATSKGAAEI